MAAFSRQLAILLGNIKKDYLMLNAFDYKLNALFHSISLCLTNTVSEVLCWSALTCVVPHNTPRILPLVCLVCSWDCIHTISPPQQAVCDVYVCRIGQALCNPLSDSPVWAATSLPGHHGPAVAGHRRTGIKRSGREYRGVVGEELPGEEDGAGGGGEAGWEGEEYFPPSWNQSGSGEVHGNEDWRWRIGGAGLQDQETRCPSTVEVLQATGYRLQQCPRSLEV